MATPADAGRAIYASVYFPKEAKALGEKLHDFKAMSDGAQRHVLAHLLYLNLQQLGLLTVRIEELLDQGAESSEAFQQLLARAQQELPPHLQTLGNDTSAASDEPTDDEPTDDEPTAGREGGEE